MVCEVKWCSGAGATNGGRGRVSYALGVETMKNDGGKIASSTQGKRGITDKDNGLSAKRAALGLVGEHVIKAGLAELVRDVFQCVEGNKCSNISKAKWDIAEG